MFLPKMTPKLFFSMMYLGLIAIVAGLFFYRIQSFEGTLIIEAGRTERWITKPAGESGIFSAAHRNMPAEVIGFDNPRAAIRVLGARESFDAVLLPFRVSLDGVEVLEQPREVRVMEIVQGAERKQLPAEAGAAVMLPEGSIAIRAVEPWTGLIRDGRGPAMAVCALGGGILEKEVYFFVNSEMAARPCCHIALYLNWFEDESTAREAFTQHPTPFSTARWGVRDVNRIHWFETFLPGTGVTTDTGDEYTLINVVVDSRNTPPVIQAIDVSRLSSPREEVFRVEANAAENESKVLLEVFQDEMAVTLYAWRDGAALALLSSPRISTASDNEVLTQEDAPLPILLEEHEPIELKTSQGVFTLRLEQLMGAAVPVMGEEQDVWGVTMDTPLGLRRLREGESLLLKESRIAFRRIPGPVKTQYSLSVRWVEDKNTTSFTLVPGKSRRIGAWRLVHDQPHPKSDQIALLTVQRVVGTPAHVLGALLFFGGALGWCGLRFGDWNTRRNRCRTDLDDEKGWTKIEDNKPSYDIQEDEPTPPEP